MNPGDVVGFTASISDRHLDPMAVNEMADAEIHRKKTLGKMGVGQQLTLDEAFIEPESILYKRFYLGQPSSSLLVYALAVGEHSPVGRAGFGKISLH
jgi:hypothetical protein